MGSGLWRAVLGVILLGFALAVGAQPADFHLRDYLNRAWTNERVSFLLTPAQLAHVNAGHALRGPDGPVAYQLSPDGARLLLLTDLHPFETREFHFADTRATAATDLIIEETPQAIRLTNGLTGITLAKTLDGDAGPITAVRLTSGKWVSASRLVSAPPIAGYTAEITARGPVSAEARCRVTWADGGAWELRVRLDAREPAVLLDEMGSVNAQAALTFRIDRGFTPNMLFFRYGGSFDGISLGANVVAEMRHGTNFVLEPWLHWQYAKARGACVSVYTQPVAMNDGGDDMIDDELDMLSIAAREAGVWVDPKLGNKQAHATVDLVKNANGLQMTFPLKHGQRKWMLLAQEKMDSLAVLAAQKKGQRLAPPPYRYLIKHGHFPLDQVKDYIYTWENTDEHPREIFTKADIARFRKGITDLAPYEAQARRFAGQVLPPNQEAAALKAYLATAYPGLGKAIVNTALRQTQEVVDYLIKQDGLPFGCAPHNNSDQGIAPVMADFALGTAEITPEQRARLLAQLAFLGYTLDRPEYWSPERGYASLPNMTTTVYGYQTSVACAIPSHPLAQRWVKTALTSLQYQVDNWSDDNGGWLEAPHYAMVSYDVFVGSFLKLHNAGFSDTLYSERMKKIIAWFGKISTPPDPRIHNMRHLPPIGNTYLNEPTGEFGILAYLWRDKDPAFAAEMQWMHQQMHAYPEPGIGGAYPALMGFRGLLLDPTIPAKVPAWGSELFPRTGAILRSGFPTARETQLHVIAGDFRSHYDIDSGSITLWGKGRPLADDFGYYGCAPVVDHSRIDSPQATGNMMPKAFSTTLAFDYFRGQAGGWTRQIAFVKDADPLAPNYFVIRDSLAATAPATWRLWSPAAKVRLGREGAMPAPEEDLLADNDAPEALPDIAAQTFTPKDTRDFCALVNGKDDVDLDVIFLGAPWTLKTEEKMRVSASGLYPDNNWRAMPSTQIGLIATQENTTGLTAVLYPRLRTEKPPVITTLADGKGVKVQHAAGTDYIFLSPEPFTFTEGTITFTGTTGLVKIRAGKETVVALGAEGTIAAGKVTATK
jgi:hypothetical protein